MLISRFRMALQQDFLWDRDGSALACVTVTPVAEPVEARATDPFDKLRDRELRENSGRTQGPVAQGPVAQAPVFLTPQKNRLWDSCPKIAIQVLTSILTTKDIVISR